MMGRMERKERMQGRVLGRYEMGRGVKKVEGELGRVFGEEMEQGKPLWKEKKTQVVEV